jgi:hypothetical protein
VHTTAKKYNYGRSHHRKYNNSFFQSLINLLLQLINNLLQRVGLPPLQNPGGQIPTITPIPTGINVSPMPISSVNPCPSNAPSTAVPTITISQIQPTAAIPSTAVAGCTQTDIQNLVNSVSQANITANLKELVQDDNKTKPNELISRHISSPGNKIKTDWILQTIIGYGLQTQLQPFKDGGTSLNNVVATIPGTSTISLYGIGAHFDSQSENPKNVAPGADDNGSGTVVWMEVARVLKGFQSCMKSSVNLVGFNDEEEGELGSVTYIKSTNGKTMKGFYNLDSVGYTPTGECMKSDANLSTDQPIAQKLLEINTKYNIGMNITSGKYNVADIDNSSFWEANLPSAYLVECVTERDAEVYPHYHTTTDNTAYVNFAQLTKLTKLLVATLAELASQ